jgi:hypothetical protein
MDNTSINTFLGLNLNETGSTNLKLGESSKMVNFKISRDCKLEKMYGYINKYERTSKIRAMWFGMLGSSEVYVYVCGGKVYNGDTEIGSITDDITRIFEFNKKLYFINGHEYKEWNGTTFKDVEGYIPLIKIATTPNGVGTDYEPINVLTGKKRQTFSADGEKKVFYLAETEVDSIDSVKVNGVETTVNKNLANGTITFTTAPTQGVDNIEVQWAKGSGQRELVYQNHYFQTYGLADDTRVFLYGNSEAKNRIYFSDLGNGIADVTYFPGNNFIDVGSSNMAVTDIQRQYDRLLVSKEDTTYYTTYEQITDSTGESIVSFPMYPLNKSHGAKPYNQGQVLDNYVTTIDTSIVQWTNTESKDERNAQIISQKVQTWLNEKDLSKAVTLDYQEDKEYWLAIGNEVLVYNYENGCYSLLNLNDQITVLISYKGVIYGGTENGKIIEFDKNATTYGGETIKAEWQSGYYDFGIEEQRKTMRVLWITLKPWFKTSLQINYASDRDSGSEDKTIENRSISYEHWNYARFTYNTQRSVRPFRVKMKAKKFAFLKLILKNEVSDEKVTVNSIAIKKVYGGEVK